MKTATPPSAPAAVSRARPASSRRPPPAARLVVTFLAMPCDEPAPVLAALLAAPRVGIASVVLAAAGGCGGGSAVERLAGEAGLRVVPARTMAEAAAAIEVDAPDVAVAACFPWRVPARVRALPRLGVLNVHPSLLPRGRGPEPVFWTLRTGERETGVTVHVMDDGLDTGPVLAQARMAVPPGGRAPELERELMAVGGGLLVDVLPRLASGELRPMPQDDASATHAPFPVPADWIAPATLPAGWAWNFIRGVAPLGGPLAVAAGGRVIPVEDVIDHDPWERPAEAVVDHGDGTLTVRFSPGWVRVRAEGGGRRA